MPKSRLAVIAALLAGCLVIAVAAAAAVGELVWRRGVARDFARLDDGTRRRASNAPRPFTHDDLAQLPRPVARYLALAIPEGHARIEVARIQWKGEMRLQPNGPWSPFTAEQRYTTQPPGFVWNARFRMMPLIPVFVRDGYVDHTGQMIGRIGGVVSVVHEGGTPEMAQSALARWLGEAAWFPTAFLPGEGITWDAVDDSTARATISDGSVRVSADFHFAASGELARMTAMRYRAVDGRAVLTPFEGRYEGFVRRDGVMIPASAEVSWLLPAGPYAYWRAEPVYLSRR